MFSREELEYYVQLLQSFFLVLVLIEKSTGHRKRISLCSDFNNESHLKVFIIITIKKTNGNLNMGPELREQAKVYRGLHGD
jgi:hypothetical protein